MRRLVCAAALFSVLLLAAPAVAQVRDPFDPLLTTGSETDTDTGITTDTPPVTTPPAETPLVNPPPPSDDLPNTGADPKNLLTLAYVLLAAGGVMVAISHVGEPYPRRAF